MFFEMGGIWIVLIIVFRIWLGKGEDNSVLGRSIR